MDAAPPSRDQALPVDVVILTWNDADLLYRAIESVLASEGVDVRVTVVDNGSTPPVLACSDPRVRLVRNDVNRGVAAGRNQGVKAGAAPYVCILDSDARLAPHSLRTLGEVVRREADVALAAPVFTHQRPENSAGKAPSLWRKAARVLNLTDAYASSPRTASDHFWDVDFSIGACQFFRRSAFEAVGGLDERYFYGPEDVDFCLRLRQRGWRVVQVAGAACDHPARRRNRQLFTRRGAKHAVAVACHLWRHRRYTHQRGSRWRPSMPS